MTTTTAARDTEFDPSYFPASTHADAVAALNSGDALGFLAHAMSRGREVEVLWRNRTPLARRGLLEEAFVHTVTQIRPWNPDDAILIPDLLKMVDRRRLRAAGDPPPDGAPWTLYRTVPGRGPAGHPANRKVRGYSWTASLEYAHLLYYGRGVIGLPNRAIYRSEVHDHHVLFYWNRQEEQEFFLNLPASFPIHRLEVPSQEKLAQRFGHLDWRIMMATL